jgi:PTS system nitrogen regulatory IIA component
MSTGIGKGIALPHPRNPLVQPGSGQFVALAFLEHPVGWNSLDGEQADTLLLIVSASAKEHLQTLSKINFFCRQEDFYRLLKARPQKEEILRYIRETEKTWN